MSVSGSVDLAWGIRAPSSPITGSVDLAWAVNVAMTAVALDGAPSGLTGTVVVELTSKDGTIVMYGPTAQGIRETPVGTGRYVALIPTPAVGDYFVVWQAGDVVAFADLQVVEDVAPGEVAHTIYGDRWADGTNVNVYPSSAWFDPASHPSGVAVANATVDGGAITFTGLELRVRYVAYAAGVGVHFMVQPTISSDITGTSRGREREDAVEAKLTALAATVDAPSFITDPIGVEAAARATADTALGGRLTALEGARVIDEAANVRDSRWGEGGAVGDGVTDDFAAVDAAVQASIVAPLGRVFVPPGDYLLSEGVVVTTNGFRMDGVAGGECILRQDKNAHQDVFTVQAAQGGWESNQGRITGLTFSTTETGGWRTDGKAGLVLNGVRHFHVQDCEAQHLDIGFDMRNNCFGSRFIGCTSSGDYVVVGLLLRGATPSAPFTAGSGSDITMIDNWLGGVYGGIWMEPNAGGYHVYGGQVKGGGLVTWGLNDYHGSVLLGRGYDQLATTTADVLAGAANIPVSASGTDVFFSAGGVAVGDNHVVTYSGLTGDEAGGTLTGVGGVGVDIPSGTPIYSRGRVAAVELNGLSFEGTDKRHAVRAYDTMDNVSLNDCSVNSNGSNRIINVIKGTDCKNSTIVIRRTAVRGIFSGAVPLVLSNLSGGWDVSEETPTNAETATFNSVGMDFTSRPMIERSSIGTRSRAFFGDKVRFGGRTLRWNGSVLESHTDSSSGSGWAPAAAPTQGITLAGTTVIATTQTLTAPTSYAKAATADEVTGVVVATNGLIGVLYRATWQESVIGAALATIFLGANAVKISGRSAAAPLVAEAGLNAGAANTDKPLTTWPGGLIGAGTGSTAYTGDVATGQIFGQGQISTLDSLGGVCWIEVPAGTYTVSIQFKASSGNVTVKNRRLQVFTAA